MGDKKNIGVLLQVLFVVFFFLLVSGCATVLEITFSSPDSTSSQKKPQETSVEEKETKEAPNVREVAKEATDLEKEADKTSSTKEVAKEAAEEQKEVEEATSATEVAKETPSSEKKENILVYGIVNVEKNKYYISDFNSNILYRLVGLHKEEKSRLDRMLGANAKLELRVVSTESAKAYNAQLVNIIEEPDSVQAIAKEAPAKKEDQKVDVRKIAKDAKSIQEKSKEKPAEQKVAKETPATKKEDELKVAKDTAPVKKEDDKKIAKETASAKQEEEQTQKAPEQKIAKETKSSDKKKEEVVKSKEKEKESDTTQVAVTVEEESVSTTTTTTTTATTTASEETEAEELIVEGIIIVEKNDLYISDPESEKRYRLVGLKKDEKNMLKKLKGNKVCLEIKVVSTESKKAYNAELIRMI
jgi:uncharacterized protein YceK